MADFGRHVVFRSNSIVGTPGAVFVNPLAFDYRPKTSSGYIDTADAESATTRDILGYSRIADGKPDRGVYEMRPDMASAGNATFTDDEEPSDEDATPNTTTDPTGAKRIGLPARN
jgi:hypothetical protein